jgi:hypothetical protein
MRTLLLSSNSRLQGKEQRIFEEPRSQNAPNHSFRLARAECAQIFVLQNRERDQGNSQPQQGLPSSYHFSQTTSSSPLNPRQLLAIRYWRIPAEAV